MWRVNNLLFRDAQTFFDYLKQFKDQPVAFTYTNTVSINNPMEQ
jgi:hypothetical protein